MSDAIESVKPGREVLLADLKPGMPVLLQALAPPDSLYLRCEVVDVVASSVLVRLVTHQGGVVRLHADSVGRFVVDDDRPVRVFSETEMRERDDV